MAEPVVEAHAEFGCEHIAKLITEERLSMTDFRNLLDQTVSKSTVNSGLKTTATTDKSASATLSSHYHCIQCSETGSTTDLNYHAMKKDHGLAFESRSRTLYCAHCKDLVYDQTMESVRLSKVAASAHRSPKRKFSEANEDDAFWAENSTQPKCGQEGVRGLFNLGETCYMNAILQMMVHNQLLSSYFLGNGHPAHTCSVAAKMDARANGSLDDDDDEDEGAAKPEYQPCVGCGVSEVFAESRKWEMAKPMEAVNLLFASWKAIPHMAGKSQQDAQEYYMMLVDKLHETLAPATDSKGRCHCFFHQAFFGRLQSEVTCDGCGAVSRTQDPFSAISLDFQKQVKRKKKAVVKMSESAIPDLHSALQNYTSPELLPAEEYTCRGCGVPKPASKRLSIRKLPAILCIQVKRFGGRMAGGFYLQEKHEGKIDFPVSIDMEPYTARKKVHHTENLVYDLESVIVHHGQQLQNGHYFAFCRQGDRWYKFDDEIVSVSTTEEVLRQEAYLLFYSLRSLSAV